MKLTLKIKINAWKKNKQHEKYLLFLSSKSINEWMILVEQEKKRREKMEVPIVYVSQPRQPILKRTE